ncbi:hypothetical protein ERX37_03450 [Macrococcus hajekii]|uniref:Uncharacterized protein n=1 Tax=Macrococcus hajekii TaxID=198482 RepID=A0A4R6BMT5_9STAP|nr:hypothetical protein [Macrococcus hajekii]TDM03154.1 hypothetical protein ERX37_03450 [Macrococcus hajekii]GGA96399.1 hypothetical protein GCM10007190_00570 [Macrococcus hajekii]
MDNFYEIKLNSGKKGKSRKVQISKVDIISLENNAISYRELYRIFDPEKYNMNPNEKLGGAHVNQLIKTAEQFFDTVTKEPNPNDKRAKQIRFGKLYNQDGQPIERINKRKDLGKASYLFMYIILNNISKKEIPNVYQTKTRWLETFGLMPASFNRDYYSFIDSNAVNENGNSILLDELSEEGYFNKTYKYLHTEYDLDISDESELDTSKKIIEVEVKESRKKSLFQAYINKSKSFLINNFNSALKILERDNIIFIDSKYQGDLIKLNDSGHEYTVNYTLNQKEEEYFKEIYETCTKEYEQKFGKSYKVFDVDFRNIINEQLSKKGLNNEDSRRFKRIYKVYSIKFIQNNDDILNYVKGNEVLNSYEEMTSSELWEVFSEIYINYFNDSSSRDISKRKKVLDNKVEKGFGFGDVEDFLLSDLKDIKNLSSMTEELEKLATKLIKERHRISIS